MFIVIKSSRTGDRVGTVFITGATTDNRYGRYIMKAASKAYGRYCVRNGLDNTAHYWEWDSEE